MFGEKHGIYGPMKTAGLDVYEQIKTTGLVLVSDSMASCCGFVW